jgi:hypothetical protein
MHDSSWSQQPVHRKGMLSLSAALIALRLQIEMYMPAQGQTYGGGHGRSGGRGGSGRGSNTWTQAARGSGGGDRPPPPRRTYSLAHSNLTAHCIHGRPLDSSAAMERFVQYALEYMQTDDTFVLSALGRSDGAGLQRLREICEGHISTQVQNMSHMACSSIMSSESSCPRARSLISHLLIVLF